MLQEYSLCGQLDLSGKLTLQPNEVRLVLSGTMQCAASSLLSAASSLLSVAFCLLSAAFCLLSGTMQTVCCKQ